MREREGLKRIYAAFRLRVQLEEAALVGVRAKADLQRRLVAALDLELRAAVVLGAVRDAQRIARAAAGAHRDAPEREPGRGDGHVGPGLAVVCLRLDAASRRPRAHAAAFRPADRVARHRHRKARLRVDVVAGEHGEDALVDEVRGLALVAERRVVGVVELDLRERRLAARARRGAGEVPGERSDPNANTANPRPPTR
ncbi:hypothetical protein WMF04_32740 [Sorangium sp. So ce260]|uniref:hypothetical protein n=1 Tax=Sorangium sp. So ce260 TaxID=3133291 RepID=UPI003F64574F